MADYDVIIIGGGTAGFSAGMYSSRLGMKTLLVERLIPGGQIINVERIEDYPGLPDGISGADFSSKVQEQAIASGTEFAMSEVMGLRKSGHVWIVDTYEGEKISKSKGNGVTIDQWLEYASPESLSLYMYQNPKRAKKLYREVVPKAMDEYLDFIEKGKNQSDLEKLMNPVWHVHNGKIPNEKIIMSFSMLLNLVETSNADNKKLLWKFVKKYKQDIKEDEHPIFDNLINYAIKYFNDVIKTKKVYKTPNENEKGALNALIKSLDNCNDDMAPEELQTNIFTVGKENGYKENLRDWFKLIYEVVFGDENGPRMGFFISFFGVQETKQLIKNKLNNV